MDWAGERYVRLYVRDTVTWRALGWQGQAVLILLMRRLDRSGIMDIGTRDPESAIAIAIGLPAEIISIGWARLLEEEVFEQSDQTIVMPNFLEAQEAVQTDALRAKEYRARKRDKARSSQNVTLASQNVSRTSRAVTQRHAASRAVTPYCTVPSCTEEDLEPSALVPDGTSDDDKVAPKDLIEGWNEAALTLGLPSVREVRGSRLRKLQLRLTEHPSPEFWQAVFAGLQRSKFLIGQNGTKGLHASWKASFDWLIENDVNATKVAEGRYA